ncbi:glycosyltransferase family 4 protein [Candidatus Omnitrophota bacterium]
MKQMKKNILFADLTHTASLKGIVGGSSISLYLFIKNLDRSQYNPIVLLNFPNKNVKKLEALKCKVILLNRKTWDEMDFGGLSRLSVRTKKKLHSNSLFLNIYNVVVFFLRVIVDILPRALRTYLIIKKHKISLVHVNRRIPTGRFAIIAARLSGVPVVCHERWFSNFTEFDLYLSQFTKAVICVSRAVQSHCMQAGLRTPLLTTVHNGFDFSEFKINTHRKEREFLHIGIAGLITQWKGQHIFIEACAKVKREYRDLKFFIVGLPYYDDYQGELERLIKKLNLQDDIEFTGYIDDVNQIMDLLDIVVHASVEPEPCGRIVIESMGFGKPLIATRLGGNLDLVEDGVSGLLIQPGDSKKLADAILFLINNPNKSKQLGANAMKRVRDKFSIEGTVNKIEQIYRDILY